MLRRTLVLCGLQDWVYRRCKQAGLPPPAAVHLVSSVKGSGVRDLMTDLQEKVGTRGDVWVVGAQNAGKSSLINAMQKVSGVKAKKQITTAALPGTTLGKRIRPWNINSCDWLILMYGSFELVLLVVACTCFGICFRKCVRCGCA